MKSTNLKSVMNKLKKQADMPMFEGMGGDGAATGSTARVQWKKFNAGTGNLVQGGPLPPEITARLTSKINEFREEFEQFATSDKTGGVLAKYRGLIFPYYAPDFIGNDVPEKVRALPGYLRETMDFVREHNIVLPNIGQGGGKGIGSPYWMSHYGYAYQKYAAERGHSVTKGQKSRAREIRKVPASVAENNGWPWGQYAIQETENGAGIFIDTAPSSSGIGVVPVLDPNSNPKPRWRLFKGELDPKSGASNVIIRGGPQSSDIEPAKRVNLGRLFQMDGRTVALDPTGNPIPKGTLNDAQYANARRAYDQHVRREEAAENGELYQMRLSPEGTISLRNVANPDQWFPMTGDQLRAILKDGWNQDLPEVAVVPEQAREDQGASGAMGKFTGSEELMAELSAEDGQGYFRTEAEGPVDSGGRNPVSFESLRELAAFLGGGRVSVNAYRLAVIGPVFSQAKALGEGQAELTGPMMMSPETSVDPATNTMAVERGIQWGLHMTNQAPGRMKGVGDRASTAWKTQVTDSVEEAFQLLQAEALKFDPDSDLSAVGQDSARIAQMALEKTVEQPADATTDVSVQPNVGEQDVGTQFGGQLAGPGNVTNQPAPYDTPFGQRTSSIKKLMRRLSKK